MPSPWSINPLLRGHGRAHFECGESALDDYLHRYALQHQRSGIARSFVAVDDQAPQTILGYYSLAVGSIAKANLPPQAARRLPQFPIPIARLARLAVRKTCQGQGLGEHLLMDALARSARIADEIGLFAVLVDAKYQRAMRFYQRYEFNSLPGHPLTLWLPITAVKGLFRT